MRSNLQKKKLWRRSQIEHIKKKQHQNVFSKFRFKDCASLKSPLKQAIFLSCHPWQRNHGIIHHRHALVVVLNELRGHLGPVFFGHRPKWFWNDWIKWSHFGQNVWKYRLMNTVTASFNKSVRQTSEMSSQKKLNPWDSCLRRQQLYMCKLLNVWNDTGAQDTYHYRKYEASTKACPWFPPSSILLPGKWSRGCWFLGSSKNTPKKGQRSASRSSRRSSEISWNKSARCQLSHRLAPFHG